MPTFFCIVDFVTFALVIFFFSRSKKKKKFSRSTNFFYIVSANNNNRSKSVARSFETNRWSVIIDHRNATRQRSVDVFRLSPVCFRQVQAHADPVERRVGGVSALRPGRAGQGGRAPHRPHQGPTPADRQGVRAEL